MTRARRAASARPVRLLTCRLSSIRSRFVRIIVLVMNTIIVYKWMLQSTSPTPSAVALIFP